MQLVCSICGQPIGCPYPGKIYCSRRCRLRAARLVARGKEKALRAGIVVRLAQEICPQCDNSFDPRSTSQKFCSIKCRQRASNRRNALVASGATRRNAEPLSWLDPRPCKHCKTDFRPRTPRQLYCSLYCRVLENGETLAKALRAAEKEKNV